MRLAQPIACQDIIDWTYRQSGAIKSTRLCGKRFTASGTVQAKPATSPTRLTAATMQMIGLSHLIHLNAVGGDGESVVGLCVAVTNPIHSRFTDHEKLTHDWRKT